MSLEGERDPGDAVFLVEQSNAGNSWSLPVRQGEQEPRCGGTRECCGLSDSII